MVDDHQDTARARAFRPQVTAPTLWTRPQAQATAWLSYWVDGGIEEFPEFRDSSRSSLANLPPAQRPGQAAAITQNTRQGDLNAYVA
jgi:hypothetical protein